MKGGPEAPPGQNLHNTTQHNFHTTKLQCTVSYRLEGAEGAPSIFISNVLIHAHMCYYVNKKGGGEGLQHADTDITGRVN
jgi:hypothetical protein